MFLFLGESREINSVDTVVKVLKEYQGTLDG